MAERKLALRIVVSFVIVVASSMCIWCTPDVESCRYDWYDCGGYIGGICDVDMDCVEGFCCTTDNCGNGMCTYHCDDDRDCPPSMGCEHDTCFYLCDSDSDCAHGWECEHGNTICEWD